MFDPMRREKPASWKLTAAGIAALVIVGGSLIAYFAWGATHHTTTAAAEEAAAEHAPALAIGTVSGAAAAPVEAPIKLTGADGLGSASLTLTYDPAVVSVLQVRNGNVAQSQLTWRHDAKTGVLTLLLTTALAKGAAGEGTLAFVTLQAVDGAVGHVSPLTLAVKNGVLANGESVTIAPTSGSFRNGVPGDVTGNGLVDKDDYERLADYLVGDDVTIVMLNADLDGDGKVTPSDAVKLHQQLAEPAVVG